MDTNLVKVDLVVQDGRCDLSYRAYYRAWYCDDKEGWVCAVGDTETEAKNNLMKVLEEAGVLWI